MGYAKSRACVPGVPCVPRPRRAPFMACLVEAPPLFMACLVEARTHLWRALSRHALTFGVPCRGTHPLLACPKFFWFQHLLKYIFTSVFSLLQAWLHPFVLDTWLAGWPEIFTISQPLNIQGALYCVIQKVMRVLVIMFELFLLKAATGVNFSEKYPFFAILMFAHFDFWPKMFCLILRLLREKFSDFKKNY